MQDKSSKKITSELFKMQPDAMVEMFDLDFSILQEDFSELQSRYGTPVTINNDPVYRFTSNINGSNPVYWQGNAYQPLPIETSDFESPSDGRLPRPKLKISNPSGLLSSIVAVNHDFHGCKVTRKRTFVKFLDDQNFPANEFIIKDVDGDQTIIRNRNQDEGAVDNAGDPLAGSNPFGSPDPNAHLPDDVYYIHRKLMDSRDSIEFEMTSILEVGDLQFPDRQIMADYCSFRYRDPHSCNYSGIPIMGPNGDRFADHGIYKFFIAPTFNTDPNKAEARKELNGQIGQTMRDINEWHPKVIYQKGDIVMLTKTHVPAYYVCIKEPNLALDCPAPSVSEEIWMLDACTKTLSSCICHFGSDGCNRNKGMNFGGFPSTAGARYAGK